MGASDPRTFAKKAYATAGALKAVPGSATRQVLEQGRRVMLASLAASGAASRHVRNARGRGGGRLDVSTDLHSTSASATGALVPRGPWHLLEESTSPHEIPRHEGGKRLRLPDGGVRRQVPHPGTEGKHPWRRGEEVIRRSAPKVYEHEVSTTITSIF